MKHEDNLGELQTQFQNLLDQKIMEIQDDATEQINNLKQNERELRNLLEEKMIQLQKDYIKISQHQEILYEKQTLIEKLKQELFNKDNEHKQELNYKLKNFEERKMKDYEVAQLNFKCSISYVS